MDAINKRLYDFFDILRDAKINISTDEVLCIFNALPYIDATDKEIFQQTLRTTLIKDYTDIPVFNKCFDNYFLGDLNNEIDLTLNSSKLSAEEKDNLKQIEELLEKFLESITEDNFFEKDAEEILRIFIEELTSNSSGGAGISILPSAQQAVVNSLISNNQSSEDSESLAPTEYILGVIKNRQSKNLAGKKVQDREDYLLNKFIYQLTPEEIKEMRELIRRFGQKLKNRISLKKKKFKHGGIDIKRTFRNSMQFDGIPFQIFHKEKKIDRPQLVVLCDVSGSVNQYTRFMLLLTHTLQSLFFFFFTFAFLSNMVEITKLFMEMDPERAINSIFTDTDFTYGWGSNYGGSLEQFVENYSDSLNKKATVLILGDARNNNNDEGIDYLIKIKERSRNLFWLNPEKKHLWDWSDSIASLYKEYCDDMREVNNFIDLSEFIDKLFIDI